MIDFKTRMKVTSLAAPAAAVVAHAEANKSKGLLRTGVWIYFILLIIEGALRKWCFPSLATPLLLVRDPVAVWMILYAFNARLLPVNIYLCTLLIVGVVSIFTAVFLGHGNIIVAAFGARIFLIHFPLIFIIGNVLDRKDLLRICSTILWMSIPMTILIGIQFYSPQSAWVNRGIGGDENGAGFSGALDFLRPPGTFSFTNGTTLFYGLVISILLYFWINPEGIKKILLISAMISLTAAIPFSISRSLLLQVIVALVFTLIAVLWNKKLFRRVAALLFVAVISVGLLAKLTFFSTASEAFQVRFATATEHEGGMSNSFVHRYFKSTLGSVVNIEQVPFWGHGIGMGTSVGSMMLAGERVYLLSEEEWGRLIGELGFLLGGCVIFCRVILVGSLAIRAFRRLPSGDTLPWMLMAFGIMNIAQGQWAQPTSLGFGIFSCGLIVAAIKPHPSTRS
jgi:hypothetical protein